MLFTAHTKDTMSNVYLDALKIRQTVFVKEQKVPESLEIDENEARTIHFVLYEETDQPMATLRLLPVNKKKIKVQRMAVLKEFRQQGLGRVLMEAAEQFAKEQGFETLVLGAQLTALPFYESLNYQKDGDEFLDAGMPHMNMYKRINE